MYLKSLQVRGFKSFASATTLHFEPGITCVVGPNGSGKSNVVDALSWVMGEQGAKSLRGGKMEDVIFAGTAGRAPLGRAEVVLTIDNSDGALPIEYTEVTISRTMFRSGGSEYAINGHSARLLDVQELLSDSGIGREMHVVVAQGQLDTILQATPEIRRGLIEEAAGVLKHRKRKEKAARKLESTQQNLDRLQDLITEIRRQLKPLGRQASVARRAAVIQAELRDAKARLLADDLTHVTLALESDLADEAALQRARQRAEVALREAQQAEEAAEAAVAAANPRQRRAQDTWYALAGLRERVSTTLSIAAERMRHADAQPDAQRQGRDPEHLEREAGEISAAQTTLADQLRGRRAALDETSAALADAERAHQGAEHKHAAQLRAIADRREGLARLTGQVNSARSRTEAADDELERLTARKQEALGRADEAARAFTRLETQVVGLDDGESGLDEVYEDSRASVEAQQKALDEARSRERELAQRRASLGARVEALQVGLTRKDGSAALLGDPDDVAGLVGSLAGMMRVHDGWDAAVATALGAASDAVVLNDLTSAVQAVGRLRSSDLGRANMLVVASNEPDEWPTLPDGIEWAIDLVSADEPLHSALRRALRRVACVEGLDQATRLLESRPGVTAATRDGDLVSDWFVAGGTGRGQSLIEAQAAHDEAVAGLATTSAELEKVRFRLAAVQRTLTEHQQAGAAALERLHESDAEMAALAEQLGQLGQQARSARAEADRLEVAIVTARNTHVEMQQTLEGLERRLALASTEGELCEPDNAERDELGRAATLARQAEMDARLALRTDEERMRALAGNADSLRRAAQAERSARRKATQRAEQLRREAHSARAVHQAASWLMRQVEASADLATEHRATVEADRITAEQQLADARRRVREVSAELDTVIEGAHRDEMARIEQRMRIETLAERAMTELGLEADTLMDDYGPDRPIPLLAHPDGTAIGEDDERPEPVAFVREQQAKRLRAAERNLQVLGRVNPLALEEFDAMQERHTFLAEQLEDLRRTRQDLLDIINEVDRRVQEVFAAAYTDVASTFEDVFARLFPGGEGRLVLTEQDSWLTTGVDVEARPAGKKVKRLSLLSGGERSLVAVAFLVSLFMARPSPFYILDEVEAALDDVNLGRLLAIYEELRETSQLLVITHQKRTMEIADALYGVTMRGDGVSQVISQRLTDR